MLSPSLWAPRDSRLGYTHCHPTMAQAELSFSCSEDISTGRTRSWRFFMPRNGFVKEIMSLFLSIQSPDGEDARRDVVLGNLI